MVLDINVKNTKIRLSDDILMMDLNFPWKCFNSINKVQYHFIQQKLNGIVDKCINYRKNIKNVIEETYKPDGYIYMNVYEYHFKQS